MRRAPCRNVASVCRVSIGRVWLRARSRIVSVAPHASFETPLLVPSFSSRGFPTLPHGRAGKTRPGAWVHTTTFAPLIDDALLLSAHDVHHELVDGAKQFQKNPGKSIYSNARIVFLDSGLYESRSTSDMISR